MTVLEFSEAIDLAVRRAMDDDDRVVVFLVDLDSFALRGFQDPQE